jgi:hypothetical protein
MQSIGRSKLNVGFFLFCSSAFLVIHAQDNVPFMPTDQFESKIDLTFKKRESSDPSTYTFSDGSQPKKTTDTPIAFLIVNFKLLRADGEVKVKVIDGRFERVSRINVGTAMKLEIGFIEDVKKRSEEVSRVCYF